jgi:hypothetical protein
VLRRSTALAALLAAGLTIESPAQPGSRSPQQEGENLSSQVVDRW